MINRVKSRSESRGKSQGFVYKKRDPATLKARAEQTGGRFDSIFKQGFDTFRPKPGDNLIRFLPPTWEGAEHYAMDIWVHRFIGADSSTYLCLDKMGKGKCPICAAAKEAKDAGDKEEAKALFPVKNALAYIVDRDNPGDTPMLYAMSWTMDRDITSLCHNKRTGKVLFIDNPDEGYDVTIKRSGQGLKTRYHGIAIDRDPSPLEDDEKAQEALLEFAEETPVPETLQFFPASHLEKVLEGTAEARDEELDEVERPAGRRSRGDDDEDDRGSRRRGKGKGKEEDDEDPPFDADEDKGRRWRRGEDEGGDEEEAPRRRRRGGSEDEGEEKEAPRSRRRRSEPEEDEDEKPRSRRRSEPEEEDEGKDEEDERPARRRSRSDDDSGSEEQDDERPRSRRRADPEEEEEDQPRRRGRGKDEDDDKGGDEEERPTRRRARDEEEDSRPARRRSRGEEDEGGEEEEERPRRRAGRR